MTLPQLRLDNQLCFLFHRVGREYLESHDPERPRKLLLHRREIDRLYGRIREEGLTLVPTRVYFSDGKAKIELGLGKGKKRHDKRRDMIEKRQKREMERARSLRR
mgnify:CR=1 FL=1